MSLTNYLSTGTKSTIKTYATFLCITIIMYVFQLDTVIFPLAWAKIISQSAFKSHLRMQFHKRVMTFKRLSNKNMLYSYETLHSEYIFLGQKLLFHIENLNIEIDIYL